MICAAVSKEFAEREKAKAAKKTATPRPGADGLPPSGSWPEGQKPPMRGLKSRKSKEKQGKAGREKQDGKSRTDGGKAGQTEVTLKQTYLSALPLDSLLRTEHQRALPFLFAGPSGSSALLRGQAAVHFAFERANDANRA